MLAAEPTDTIEDAHDAVETTLVRLLRRYHGREVASGAPELERFERLFANATRIGGRPQHGWRAVCIALVTHPDFYSY